MVAYLAQNIKQSLCAQSKPSQPRTVPTRLLVCQLSLPAFALSDKLPGRLQAINSLRSATTTVGLYIYIILVETVYIKWAVYEAQPTLLDMVEVTDR
jgi:hypothetical protein